MPHLRQPEMYLRRNSRTTDTLRLGHRASSSPIWRRAFAACALLQVSFLMCSCVRTDEQAVRHAVTAELIERFRVSEEQIRLMELKQTAGAWMVRAEISAGGRAGQKRLLTCRVSRSASPAPGEARWTLTTVEDREIESNEADPRQ